MRLFALLMTALTAVPAVAQRGPYPLEPDDLCGATRTCSSVIADWNDHSWDDLVDDGFHTGTTPLAAVRWYQSEYGKSLHTGGGDCSVVNESNHQFCGVTDEFSNVLLSHAMGDDQAAYEKLRNFAELLRVPATNDLQCWKYYVDGSANYQSWSDVCVQNDSASDASLRILGAYGIACARQESGDWTSSGPDYCADYERQGEAIFGLGTTYHGEVKTLPNGDLYLANGFNNQVGAPTAWQSFRPDYYELQFLMDFAEYRDDAALIDGVKEMLDAFDRTLGDNEIPEGKTGKFTDSNATTYDCGELCSPAYMDNVDAWRAIPAVSGLLNVHPEAVSSALKTKIFDVWWDDYAGGHATLYGATDAKPFEIYSDQTPAVKQTADNGRTIAMWLPLAAAHDETTYVEDAVEELVDQQYDWTNKHFKSVADYYGGYYSQFAQRAIGAATGMIDPATWNPPAVSLISNGDFSDGMTDWWLSAGGGAAATSSVVGGEWSFDVTAGGSHPWDVFAGQNSVALKKNATYEVQFDARADSVRSLGVRVVKTSGSWNEFLSQTVNLTTAMQTFTMTFTVNDTVDPTTNFEFRLGGQGAVDVVIDNVSLTEQ